MIKIVVAFPTMTREDLFKEIRRASGGFIQKATDYLLFQLYFGVEYFGRPLTYTDGVQAILAAQKDLQKVNAKTFARAFLQIKKKGLLKVAKEELYLKPLITEAGLDRLREILPFYDEERTWDGHIYLVTYDIVEERKTDREKLRQALLKLRCAKLQASVYLTPYNPAEVLRETLQKRHLEGAVLISNLGEDGSVGEESLQELLARIYDLNTTNAAYGAFLANYGHRRRMTDKNKLIFDFLTILQDDPQLPFSLLPNDWLGGRAYRLFKNHLRLMS